MNDATVYFSPPEEEIIESLQTIYGVTYIEACDQVIMQKRELAYLHERRGNYELSATILKELGEWNDDKEAELQRMLAIPKPKKIILI